MADMLMHLYKSPLHIVIKHVLRKDYTKIHTRWLKDLK
jgi:hypothetical protein